ncbi:SDR family NAD(P)-dependent oxidoreductase [Brevibacterium moorei]|uniref:SDR family NAD(P)-dependent oxidoreductase n=1 Tax=Brevibacterium moorei TaxID=2968457 RepID=UPI00211BC0C1|nr:SDR family NAD(P)-dependent oxidoreductase [Brevibacterium sp. 68QC2CO]MCQ9386610.1 SDR family NAD(P)-dependent oxidoreductase [Brevibacterium sp. 68QC2CO]
MSAAQTGAAQTGAARASTAQAGPAQDRRVAVISGASGGVGAAIARRLAPDFDLVLLGRNEAKLRALAAELQSALPDAGTGPGAASAMGEAPAHVTCLAGDVTEPAYQAAVAAAVPGCAMLVNSAGVSLRKPQAELTRADWEHVLGVNVVAVAGLTAALTPALRAARGDVVMINSGAGQFSSPGNSLYSASKHALKAYTNSLRAEERGAGVRVTSIFPGYMDTDMVRTMPSVQDRADAVEVPFNQMVPVETLADAVALIAAAPPQATFEDITIRPTQPITIH